uniref:Adrenoceptor alpha 1B n=1 Tax=Myripristis murdjan TaxID=586833 RepID=A0A667ZKH2_9TELE
MSFDAADVVWTNGSSPTLYAETPPSRAGFNSSNLTAVPDNHTHTNHTAPLDLSRAVPVGMVLAFFIMFAIVGNILVILSVVCNRHLRIPTNYFIINLAIADLLLGTTVLPVSATLEVLDYWVFGRIFCDIWAAVDVLCCTASIMSLCVISIDRYIGVRYPLQYPMIVTEKRALLAMLGVWILAIVISIGPLLGWKQPPSQDDTECLITEEPFYALFSSLGSFYIPLAVILAMYCRVYVVAKRTTKNLEAGVMKERVEDSNELTMRIHCKNQDMSASGGGGSKGGGGAAGRSTLTVKLLKFSREKKAAKTLGVVVGMFILCWLPFFLALPIGKCEELLMLRSHYRRTTREYFLLRIFCSTEEICCSNTRFTVCIPDPNSPKYQTCLKKIRASMSLQSIIWICKPLTLPDDLDLYTPSHYQIIWAKHWSQPRSQTRFLF